MAEKTSPNRNAPFNIDDRQLQIREPESTGDEIGSTIKIQPKRPTCTSRLRKWRPMHRR